MLPLREFAKTGLSRNRKNLPPVQRSRTRRLCTLRTALLVERRSSQRFAVWGWLLAVIPSNRRLLFFQTLNDRAQPGSDRFFDLVKYQDLPGGRAHPLASCTSPLIQNMRLAEPDSGVPVTRHGPVQKRRTRYAADNSL